MQLTDTCRCFYSLNDSCWNSYREKNDYCSWWTFNVFRELMLVDKLYVLCTPGYLFAVVIGSDNFEYASIGWFEYFSWFREIWFRNYLSVCLSFSIKFIRLNFFNLFKIIYCTQFSRLNEGLKIQHIMRPLLWNFVFLFVIWYSSYLNIIF